MKKQLAALVASLGFVLMPVVGAAADPQKSLVEIYRIASGQHASFLKFIALCDRASEEAGLPPRQLYVHQDGASWDFIIIQPAEVTDEQGKKLDAAFRKLGIPQGGKFFVKIREYIAEHSDTVATGPTSAAEWLKKLD
ncbi:MAG TPA: hypothetical protein VJ011_01440 [Steroidobacteraceae bacterium]|nr:hypothetical protein [Steroidobacteraceae bacterium]